MTRIVLLRKYTLHVVYEDSRRSPQERRFFTENGKRNWMYSLPVPWKVAVDGGHYTKILIKTKIETTNLPPPPSAT